MWQPPEDQNGKIREYRVNITEIRTGKITQLATDNTSVIVGPLHPYYIYNCTIVAVTIAVSPFSTTLTVRTEEDGTFYRNPHLVWLLHGLWPVTPRVFCFLEFSVQVEIYAQNNFFPSLINIIITIHASSMQILLVKLDS